MRDDRYRLVCKDLVSVGPTDDESICVNTPNVESEIYVYTVKAMQEFRMDNKDDLFFRFEPRDSKGNIIDGYVSVYARTGLKGYQQRIFISSVENLKKTGFADNWWTPGATVGAGDMLSVRFISATEIVPSNTKIVCKVRRYIFATRMETFSQQQQECFSVIPEYPNRAISDIMKNVVGEESVISVFTVPTGQCVLLEKGQHGPMLLARDKDGKIIEGEVKVYVVRDWEGDSDKVVVYASDGICEKVDGDWCRNGLLDAGGKLVTTFNAKKVWSPSKSVLEHRIVIVTMGYDESRKFEGSMVEQL